jgi:hypothetical protein
MLVRKNRNRLFAHRTNKSAHINLPASQDITLKLASISTEALIQVLSSVKYGLPISSLDFDVPNFDEIQKLTKEISEACYTESVFFVLDIMSNPILLLMTMLDLLELLILPMALAIGIIVAVLALGIYLYRVTQSRNRREHQKNHEQFCFDLLEVMISKELCRRLHRELYSTDYEEKQWPDLPEHQLKVQKDASMSVGLVSASLLFTTYFLGIKTVLQLTNMTIISAAVLSPYSIGIAAAICIITGILLAYRHYSLCKRIQMIDMKHHQVKNQAAYFSDELARLQIYKNLLIYKNKHPTKSDLKKLKLKLE